MLQEPSVFGSLKRLFWGKTSTPGGAASAPEVTATENSPEQTLDLISALKLENNRLQSQCAQLSRQLEEGQQLKQRTFSRLRQERDEAHRNNVELSRQATLLEEQLRSCTSEVQRLQSATCSLTQVEQERNEAHRIKDELAYRVALLEEQLRSSASEIRQLRSEARPTMREIEFWKVARHEVQVTSEVGGGAWGCVAKAIFRGQEVAVKWPHRMLLDPQGRTVERLRREVRIMAQVRHPNLLLFIAAVFDEGTEPPLIVTELLAMNLRSAYEQNVLSASRLSIFRDVACALNYLHLHREPIIHRDVSAPNVLLEKRHNGNWRAKLSDFGSANLARLAHTMGEGAIIYAAPETIPSVVHDPDTPEVPQTVKIDVYSYGVLLCEVTTCRFPDPAQYRSMMDRVKEQSPFIYGLIVSCTKRRPADRPTMAHILRELDQ